MRRGGNGEGFELAGLMRFVGQAFGSPNADVRSLAIKVAAQVSPHLETNVSRASFIMKLIQIERQAAGHSVHATDGI